MAKFYYSVYKGKKKGVFETWDECKKYIENFPGARFKKFKKLDDAIYFSKHGETKEHEIANPYTQDLVIYTDGSLIKFGDHQFCGYGIYIPSKETKIAKPFTNGKKTNNRAELMAIIEAMEISLEKYSNEKIHIFTDSQYCIYIFTSTGAKYEKDNYMKNNKEVPNKDLIIRGLSVFRKLNVLFHKVEAHTNYTDVHSKGNDVADSLAVRGSSKDLLNSEMEPKKVKIPFGKHRGKTLGELPKSYINWMKTSETFEELCKKQEKYRFVKYLLKKIEI